MDYLIGLELEDVLKQLDEKGMSYVIVDNNHNVKGDKTLVTNLQIQNDKTVLVTVGEFIFSLKDNA